MRILMLVALLIPFAVQAGGDRVGTMGTTPLSINDTTKVFAPEFQWRIGSLTSEFVEIQIRRWNGSFWTSESQATPYDSLTDELTQMITNGDQRIFQWNTGR